MDSQPPPVNGAREALRGATDALLAAGAKFAIAALWEASTTIFAGNRNGTTGLGKATANVSAGVKGADRAVRQHPYLAIGMAVCLGVVLTCLCSPRRKDSAR
jgi:ElaB/YqjD/DUF883 family membrane-anchored ribosome-binding protein